MYFKATKICFEMIKNSFKNTQRAFFNESNAPEDEPMSPSSVATYRINFMLADLLVTQLELMRHQDVDSSVPIDTVMNTEA